MSTPTGPARLPIRAFRIPAKLEEQLTRIASRDHNTVSSVIRRLLAKAVDLEHRDTSRRGSR